MRDLVDSRNKLALRLSRIGNQNQVIKSEDDDHYYRQLDSEEIE